MKHGRVFISGLGLNLAVLLGATNPLDSAPGTIRGDLAIVRGFLRQVILRLEWLMQWIGCWPKCLPRLGRRREREERDCVVVRKGRSDLIQAG